MLNEELQPGCLVTISVRKKSHVHEEFLTISTFGLPDDCGVLYERIDLDTYPSCRDFKGKQTIVRHGDNATVLRKIGRPDKINCDCKWELYDVYEILLETSEVRQIFKHNIKRK